MILLADMMVIDIERLHLLCVKCNNYHDPHVHRV